jgi:hypothetical protein
MPEKRESIKTSFFAGKSTIRLLQPLQFASGGMGGVGTVAD